MITVMILDRLSKSVAEITCSRSLISSCVLISGLSKVKIAGGASAKDDALYKLDQDLGQQPDDATLAQDVTVEKP